MVYPGRRLISVFVSKLMSGNKLPLLSVCIPAYNEQENIARTIDRIKEVLSAEGIPYEFIIANDNSTDNTETVIRQKMSQNIPIRLINRMPPGGFGRAIRSCLNHFTGDIVVVVMADQSDDPLDIVKYYRKINEGYDAVFGSRFVAGAVVDKYPFVKLMANRLGNWLIQILFRTKHNDLTNAFKAYRAEALRSLLPLYASHFNLTIEISLGLLIRDFKIASIPVNWYGRNWGQANFKIKTLGRRYFATLAKLYSEKIFIYDDLMAEHAVKLHTIADGATLRDKVISNIQNGKDINNGGSGIRRI